MCQALEFPVQCKTSPKNNNTTMLRVLVLSCLLGVVVWARPQNDLVPAKDRAPTARELEQNRNAKYQFNSNIDDKISDLTSSRQETRNGLNVEGMYSYSDGYYRRTIHYVADDKGYRVTGEEVIPLDGPKIDLGGTASLDASAHGAHIRYAVKSIAVEDKTYEEVGHKR